MRRVSPRPVTDNACGCLQAAAPQVAWIQAITDRPLFLKKAMGETQNLPRYPFRFHNRQGDLEFVVSRAGRIFVAAEHWSEDDDDEDDEESMDEVPEVLAYRQRRHLAKARVAALRSHGYRSYDSQSGQNLWTFTEIIHSERSLWNPTLEAQTSVDYHDKGWKAMAEAVVKAHETRICPCSRRLCTFGRTCYLCVLETAGGPAQATKPPELIGEMALALMGEGGDWKCESEGAAVCAVCYRRKTRQMMFAECGHLACGECCAGIGAKVCPHCRGPVSALQKLIYSA